MTPVLEPAHPSDAAAIRALLAASDLPVADVDPARQHFLVARQGPGVAGCVALELHGDAALLRSLAVAAGQRGTGLGKALHAAAVEDARRRGVAILYLLTTTAEGFFANAGWARAERSAAPEAVAASAEFAALCPASAVCMVKRLAG